MALVLMLGGADRTPLLVPGSFQVTDELNCRNTASFELRDKAGTFRPEAGQAVVLTDGGATAFAGSVDRFTERSDEAHDVVRFYSVECVDYNQVPDRHLVARAYDNMSLGAIVRDIVAQDLIGEGITTEAVEDGPLITRAVFNYQTVAQAFTELADMTGMAWYIDYDKVLHFQFRDSNPAPWSIADGGVRPVRNLEVQVTREQYRNRQYIRAGQDTTDPRTETFKGDGAAKTFTLAFPVATVPTITVNGVAKAVGIRGVDTGKDWYWNKGEKEITQDDASAALAATDTLAVTYQGTFPIMLAASTDADIVARAALEGGSGLYEAVEEDQSIDSSGLARQKAEGLLRKYGRIPRTVTFETDRPGLRAGQLLSINWDAHDLTGDWLIDQVTAQDVSGKFLRYSVRALDGESLGGWTTFFRRLTNAGKTFVIRENEVLLLLRRFADVVKLADQLTISPAPAVAAEVGTAVVGFSEVG